MITSPTDFLINLFQAAVNAAKADNCLAPHLSSLVHDKVHVIGAGKAAAAMAKTIENKFAGQTSGIVVTRYGHSVSLDTIEVIEAAHPVPDALGVASARRITELAASLGHDDLALCLISGGASALLSLPHRKVAFKDKKQITRQLLKSGATIAEINCVRKHLSAIKGGQLMKLIHPAQSLTFLISDVVGDDPSTIGSGPTVGDSTTCTDVLNVFSHHDIDVPQYILNLLESDQLETPKPDSRIFARSQTIIVATPLDALMASAAIAKAANMKVIMLGDAVAGETNQVAKEHARVVRQQLTKHSTNEPFVVLSGGETTVKVTGSGKGGPNTQYALALALELGSLNNVYAIACDTDGVDGSEQNAGALIGPDTLARARSLNLDALEFLENNDAYSFFSKLDDLVVTGPTLTNVNDFRAICYLPKPA